MTNDLTLPSSKQPIFIIGAGGIVNDAHLPAYQVADFHVAGIFDLDRTRAVATAEKFSIPTVFTSIDELVKALPANSVIDVAVPGNQLLDVLKQLPDKAAVLMQKPMGNDYTEAKKIRALVEEKKMLAAVNFQLRYAPFILAAKKLLKEGVIGELCDIEIHVNVFTPWHLWSFLFDSPRVEILYHSIHYIDLIRDLLGNPRSVYAKTVKHPSMAKLASVKSNIIMDYGEMVSANILTNHCHQYGLQEQQSYIKLEGTKGAIKIQMGLLMNYPAGVDDRFMYTVIKENGTQVWEEVEIKGSWFPHAFIGSMAELMLANEKTIAEPGNSVNDCIHTMACVEAAYLSSERGGMRISDL